MLNARPPGRRAALLGLTATCVAGAVRAAPAPGFAGTVPTVLVAGPSGGHVDRWADLLLPALGRSLQPGTELARQNVGGADGVTGANQFEARAAPDGATALLVPGSAALSWLCGDPRVRFDAARWVPVWAGNTSAALASRVALASGRPIRVAVADLAGPELAALLTLELLGIEAVAVPAAADAAAALARPDVDAVLLRGARLRREARILETGGMPLALTLGTFDSDGQIVRDPAFPGLPSAPEAIARSRNQAPAELLAALRAITAASQLDVALVLPQLSPAAMVALWRRSSTALAQVPEVQTEAARTGTRPATPPGATLTTAAIVADVPTLLALRNWLELRHGWSPA